MEGIKRALRTAQAQMEEAEATARIRRAYFAIIVSNAPALFGLFAEQEKKSALSQALLDRDTDSSMLHRGLIVQVNGIFENFVRSICESVLTVKSGRVSTFLELEDKIKSEYVHQSATVLTHAKEGNVRGESYDFARLQTSLAECTLGIEKFEVRAEVFTLLMGNCTPVRLSRLFEALCLTDPFDDRIGSHLGLRKCAKERSKRKVVKFAKRTLGEQIRLRNDIAHGNLTKAITLTELQFSLQFFREYMGAIAMSTIEDLKAIEEAVE